MGVGQRFLELARANLNALLDRAASSELTGLCEEQLRAELERRDRERLAQEEERKRRIAAETEAKARAQARGASKQDPRTRGAARRSHEAGQRQSRVVELCRTLGVRPGASAEDMKHAYRALMRQHHPDKHAGDPVKQKAASERAAVITTAYAELELLLKRG